MNCGRLFARSLVTKTKRSVGTNRLVCRSASPMFGRCLGARFKHKVESPAPYAFHAIEAHQQIFLNPQSLALSCAWSGK